MMNLLSVDVGTILSDAGLTILTGLVVVFGVLLLLTGIIKVFGMAVSGLEKKGDAIPVAPAAAPAAAPAVAAPIVGNTEEVRTTPEVQNSIEPETVAVISAAVAAVAPAGTQYAVAGIRKL